MYLVSEQALKSIDWTPEYSIVLVQQGRVMYIREHAMPEVRSSEDHAVAVISPVHASGPPSEIKVRDFPDTSQQGCPKISE